MEARSDPSQGMARIQVHRPGRVGRGPADRACQRLQDLGAYHLRYHGRQGDCRALHVSSRFLVLTTSHINTAFQRLRLPSPLRRRPRQHRPRSGRVHAMGPRRDPQYPEGRSFWPASREAALARSDSAHAEGTISYPALCLIFSDLPHSRAGADPRSSTESSSKARSAPTRFP